MNETRKRVLGVASGILAIALSAFFLGRESMGQLKPPTPAPDKISRLKLDIERDRRLWWATQAQYETTITDQQRQLLGVIQSQTQKVQLKMKELDGYLGCSSNKQVIDEDLLECKTAK